MTTEILNKIVQFWDSKPSLHMAIFITAGIMLVYLIDFITRKATIPAIKSITKKTPSKWDDILFNDDIIMNTFRIIPPIALTMLIPHIFASENTTAYWCNKFLSIYTTILLIKLSFSGLNALYDISNENRSFRNSTLKGVFQMFKIISVCVGAVIIISLIIDKNPSNVLTGLGAMAAVLMLVFKDPIMGLVAGVQLSINDMLRPGDWITLPKHNADGMVIEVTLTTVKVQNWDKTITTIPPYVLVSESFQNWRGMFDSGGRRIKRSIYIDMNSISFCTKEQMKFFAEKGWLDGMEESGESVVNLSVLRNYLKIYLENHKKVNKEMILMIRQLQPTAQGLPLELYFFSASTQWVSYEHLQAEVFEHLLAIIPNFGIKVFQAPAGYDLSNFAPNKQ